MFRITIWSLVTLVASVWISADSRAQEWTRFRGPNGSGVSQAKGIPAQWTDADYNWKIKLPGVGHSSPVLWGDKLFLLSADPDDATRHMLCYDAATGEKRWQRDFASASHHLHLRNSYASCTPAVDAERVYVAWSTPEKTTFIAFDHQGSTVWELDLGTWTSQHGFGTSPILYKDMVILHNSQQANKLKPGQVPGKSFMMAFDAATGQLRWKTPRVSVNVCYAAPCIYEPEGGEPQLICTSTGDGVFSLDPQTGKENWKIPAVFSMRVCSSPILADGLIFGSTGSGGGGNYIAAVRPGEAGEVVYQIKSSSSAPYVPCMVAKDGLLFMFSDKGIVSCADASTGEIHWRERLDGTAFSGSPVIVDDKVYCIDESGVVCVVAASKEYKLLGKNPLGEDSRSTPAVAGGRMYLRTNSHLFSIGGK